MASFLIVARRSILAGFAAASLTVLGLAQSADSSTAELLTIESPTAGPFTLGEIRVERNDIFPKDRTGQFIPKLVNATHWTTRESVIRREIWRTPGETVDQAFAEELERNLRSLGLFADVTVKLVPSGDPTAGAGVRDLQVTTRDRLSIGLGAGASFVGSATSGSANLSESNVLGMGDRLRFSYRENDFGETRGNASYFDRYVAGSWTSATIEGGRREEGDAFGLSFDRPFRFLADKIAWNLSASTAGVDQDFFAGNDTVAEVPVDVTSLSASVRWRYGSRLNFWTRGFTARYSDLDYSSARGPAAASIRVPGDTQTVFAGPALSYTKISEFREVQNLDTLKFVQDVQVGWVGSLEAGAAYRDEEVGGQDQTAAGGRTQPQVSASLARTLAFGASRFASARLSGFARLEDDDAAGWRTDIDLRAFDLSWQPHTLGLAVSYTEVEETENLPIQLTLGESSGLRGYPNREFTGQRTLLINLEDRIDLDLSISAFELGAVVFADAAWIGDRGGDFEGPFTSAGVGLRVGSATLLGRGVLRMDFSVPFDDANGESFDPLFSFTIGQVFSL